MASLGQSPSSNKAERLLTKLKSPNREYLKPMPSLADYKMLAKASAREGNDMNHAVAVLSQAVLHDNVDKPRAAKKCYEKVLKLSQKLAHKELEEVALNGLAVCYFQMENYEKCIQVCRIHRGVANTFGEIVALCNEGLAYRALQDYDAAMKYHSRARKLAADLDNGETEGFLCGQVVKNLFASTDAKKSDKFQFEQEYEIHKYLEEACQSTAPHAAASAFEQLGVVSFKEEDHEEAVEQFGRALDYVLMSDDQNAKKDSHSRLKCEIGVALGEHKLQEYMRELQFAKQSRSSQSQKISLHNLLSFTSELAIDRGTPNSAPSVANLAEFDDM